LAASLTSRFFLGALKEAPSDCFVYINISLNN